MLTVQHLTKSFDGNPVLSDFSCTFPDNGIVTIVGPSGYGKTTLLRCIAGLEKPDSGEILGVPEDVYKRQTSACPPTSFSCFCSTR